MGSNSPEAFLTLRLDDKRNKCDETVMYLYAGDDPASAYKPITVYKEKNSEAYLVAGRYAGFAGDSLKYKPLTEAERNTVVEKLGKGKIVRFLSDHGSTNASGTR